MAVKKLKPQTDVALVTMPVASIKLISSYPKEKKIIIEISTTDLQGLNEPETLDEIISSSRLDYALGKYKSFDNAKDLISELQS